MYVIICVCFARVNKLNQSIHSFKFVKFDIEVTPYNLEILISLGMLHPLIITLNPSSKQFTKHLVPYKHLNASNTQNTHSHTY